MENGGAQVVSYALSICPKCLFVGTEEEFKEIDDGVERESPLNALDELEEKYPASKRYMMLAERLEKKGIFKKELGDWYLQASWAERAERMTKARKGERTSDSIALEKKCLSRALEYFGEALEAGEMEGTPKSLYSIGELFRRIDNFNQAIQFFEQAKAKLKEEKYFCIFLDDAGPEWKAVSKKIREMTPVDRKRSFFLIENLSSKIVDSLTLEDAEKKVDQLRSLGAKASIKEDNELPTDMKRLFNLIEAMERFAEQKDSSGQIIESEYPESGTLRFRPDDSPDPLW
jgi:tetratricopeptide (TPR) repeat protein